MVTSRAVCTDTSGRVDVRAALRVAHERRDCALRPVAHDQHVEQCRRRCAPTGRCCRPCPYAPELPITTMCASTVRRGAVDGQGESRRPPGEDRAHRREAVDELRRQPAVAVDDRVRRPSRCRSRRCRPRRCRRASMTSHGAAAPSSSRSASPATSVGKPSERARSLPRPAGTMRHHAAGARPRPRRRRAPARRRRPRPRRVLLRLQRCAASTPCSRLRVSSTRTSAPAALMRAASGAHFSRGRAAAGDRVDQCGEAAHVSRPARRGSGCRPDRPTP